MPREQPLVLDLSVKPPPGLLLLHRPERIRGIEGPGDRRWRSRSGPTMLGGRS